jgi:protein SMG7
LLVFFKFILFQISTKASVTYSSNAVHKSVLSCYRCFIYLGDLTRYHKELYCDPHQKDWKGATGYYRKASALQPEYGNPHNQLAVLSTYNEDEIETIYQYYRSLVIKHPFNTAADNLLVLFDKNILKYETLQKSQSQKQIRNNANRTNQDVLKSFIATFVRFQGVIFLRSELLLLTDTKTFVMKDLNLLLTRDILSEEDLLKLIVINISSISLLEVKRSSQSPSSSTKDYFRLAYLFSCEFAMLIVARALKAQNNTKYLGPIITFLEWLETQPDVCYSLFITPYDNYALIMHLLLLLL